MALGFARALVTGGAGFIGSHLVRALVARGMDVVVLDDLSLGRPEALPPGVRLVVGDICDDAALDAALAGVDIVFHLAAKVSIRASVETFRGDATTNLFGTLALLAAIARAGSVRRLIVASSMAVYPDLPGPVPIAEDHPLAPLSPYGTGKMAAETYARQMGPVFGVDVVTLRFFNVYGPGQTFTPYVGVITIFATRLLQGEVPVIFGDGEQVRDFVHVSDIVQGNLAAMDRGVPGRVYNIGSGVGLSVNRVAATLCAKLNPQAAPRYAPADRVETRNSVADIGRARAELGYAPRVAFDAGIDAVLAEIRARVVPGG